MVLTEKLDGAGFRDVVSGQLGRAVQTGIVFVPGGRVFVEGSDLCIEIDWQRSAHRKPSKRLLDAFLKLWRSPDAAIISFVKQWGGLRIDNQGRLDASFGDLVQREPLATWRYLSRRAYGVLCIAADLNRGNRGSAEDWRLLSHPDAGDPSEFFGLPNWLAAEFAMTPDGLKATGPISLDRARVLIASEISEWMRHFGTGLSLGWMEKEGWRLEVDYTGRLLAAVALQLALLTANADFLYTCSNPECAMPLYLRKKGSRGASKFCPDCGRDAALRLADRRRREKMANARRMDGEGVGIREIAKRLDTKPASVRRWIKKR